MIDIIDILNTRVDDTPLHLHHSRHLNSAISLPESRTVFALLFLYSPTPHAVIPESGGLTRYRVEFLKSACTRLRYGDTGEAGMIDYDKRDQGFGDNFFIDKRCVQDFFITRFIPYRRQ